MGDFGQHSWGSPSLILEIIAASADDAHAAVEGGADRLELCSALALGGLTPSLGTLREIKRTMDVPVMAMVRPREGGMSYSEGEFAAMLDDAVLLIENGADGVVFGILTPDSELDLPRCGQFVYQVTRAAGSRPVEKVFHRAFDVVADPATAIEQLIDLGVTRILTSGRAPEAVNGIAEIRSYVEAARGRIQILPGGGITRKNVIDIVERTGVNQVHLYVTEGREDRSTLANPAIYFGAHVPSSEVEVRQVSRAEVARIRELLDGGS